LKLSFLPGRLFLETAPDGALQITMDGNVILRTRSERAAISKFNALREEMEQRFPPHPLSDEQKAEIFRDMLKDSLVQHNSLGGRKKKTSAGGTRTFGG
jgi:hypothetical protein